MKFLTKFLYLLSDKECKNFYLLVLLTLIMSFFEMLGVLSIMPFILVLTNPSLTETNLILKQLYNFLINYGIDHNEFISYLGFFVFIFLVLSITLKALTIYLQLKFTLKSEYTIGSRLLEIYLQQPYTWHLDRNSSNLGKNILSELNNIINEGAVNLMFFITHVSIFFSISLLLLILEPRITIFSILLFSIFFLLLYTFFKNFLKKIGKDKADSNEKRFKSVQEAFSSIKELKINSLEKFFLKSFSLPAKIFSKYQIQSQLIGLMPRFILELFAFGGVILLILYLMVKNNSFNESLPVITLFVFSGYRLMPAMQQIYKSKAIIKYTEPALDLIYRDYKNFKHFENKSIKDSLTFKEIISLKNVNFNYPGSLNKILKFKNLNIAANSKVAFVGPTGSGKTTAIDLLLGLLKCDESTLEVDGQIIDETNIKLWHNCIGYVPQQVYLSDDTIEANIAFGVKDQDIDHELIEQVAKITNIDEFIKKNLAHQYKTMVGERGIKLSGGQRQRIALARALYRKPKVLILDEATSALDNHTEKYIMNSLDNLSKKITIIMVAHRLTTVRNCDNIYLFENGRIKAEGNYEKIIKLHNFFKN